jgi:uncharacterized protein (DUF433 family)
MQSTNVNFRLSKDQAQRLQRKARQLGNSPAKTAAILLDECLRRDEFAFIDFQDALVGREAYVQGSRLAVWQVISVVRSHGGDASKAAEHLNWPLVKIQAAVAYANAFPQEIEHAMRSPVSSN